MAKPILSIHDFSSGISYDETESISNGFNDLSNIDIKSILGIARLSSGYGIAGAFSSFPTVAPTNNAIEYNLLPDITGSGVQNAQAFYLDSNTRSQVLMLDQSDMSNITSLWNNSGALNYPDKSELAIYQNRIIFPTGPKSLSSIGLWTSGAYNSISGNGTNTVTIGNPIGLPCMPFLKYLTGGTLYYWNGSSYSSATITGVTVTAPIYTVTLSTTITTGNYYGYAISPVNEGIIRDDGTTLSISKTLPNGSYSYKPMLNFINNFYYGDGDMICQIDNIIAVNNTTGKKGSISVGKNYTVKQMTSIGPYMYILADEFTTDYYTFNSTPNGVNSKLLIWDGISNEFSQIIDIGGYCYGIKAIENRIYAAIKSSQNDGVIFAYFNGSDFPTIAKFQIPYADCPVNCITYDRGRFYVCVNQYNKAGAFQGSAIFEHSSYSTEQAISSSKIYEIITTTATEAIKGIQFFRKAKNTFLMKYSGINCIQYRRLGISFLNDLFQTTGSFITQFYEITPDQYGQLIRGVQVLCRGPMPATSSITINYKGDNDTSWITLPFTINSTNQDRVMWGLQRRYRKIKVYAIITDTGLSTPEIVSIKFF